MAGIENISFENLTQAAECLRRAESHAQEGKFDEALGELGKARDGVSPLLHVSPYEERGRSLLSARGKADGRDLETHARFDAAIRQLIQFTIAQSLRSVEGTIKREEVRQKKQRAAEDLRKAEESRLEGIRVIVNSLLCSIVDYQSKNQLDRAMDGVHRVFLLEPNNEKAKSMERQIAELLTQESERRAKTETQRLDEVERRRSESIHAQSDRLKAELKQRQEFEDEARRRAHEEKVAEYTGRLKSYVEQGRMDDALTELSFLLVLDPANKDIQELGLDQKIREKISHEKNESEAFEHIAPIASRYNPESSRTMIMRHISTAGLLSDRGRFTDALHIVTRAYTMDPNNKDLQACEARIILGQEAAMKNAEERLKQREEEGHKKFEEQLRRLESEEREKLVRQARKAEDEQKQTDHAKIRQYLTGAWDHLVAGRFELALGEVALAFIIDPFNEETRLMEQEILNGEHARHGLNVLPEAVEQSGVREATEPAKSEPPGNHGEGHGDTGTNTEGVTPAGDTEVGLFLSMATKELAGERFEQALDTLARASSVDPMNPAIEELEQRVLQARDAFDSRAGAAAEPGDKVEEIVSVSNGQRETDVHTYLDRARSHLSNDNFEEALNDLALAVTIDPFHPDVELLEAEVRLASAGKEKSSAPLVESTGEAQASVDYHLTNARSALGEKRYKEALEEIAVAFALTPHDARIKVVEQEVMDAYQKNGASHGRVEIGHNVDDEKKIALHLAEAERHRARQNYAGALQEIARAFLVDPFNDGIARLEEDIQKEYQGYQQTQSDT